MDFKTSVTGSGHTGSFLALGYKKEFTVNFSFGLITSSSTEKP